MFKIDIDVVKMYEDVIIPEYKTIGSSGCDIRAYFSKTFFEEINDNNIIKDNKLIIHPRNTIAITTGLKFKIPEGFEMQVRPRSGLSLKTKMRIANSPGTIDSDYLGELKIIVDNISIYDPVIINHQDRIAQLVILPVYQGNFKIVNSFEETERGEGGFGSTGIK